MAYDLVSFDLKGTIRKKRTCVFETDFGGNILRDHFADRLWEFRADGKLAKSIFIESTGLIYSHYLYDYDDAGNCTAMNFIKDGVVSSRYLFSYDSKNRQIEKVFLNPIGEVGSKEITFYDDVQNTSQVKVFTSSGRIEKEIFSKLDSEGVLLEEIIKNKDGLISRYIYEINNAAEKKVIWLDKNGNNAKSTHTQYDSFGGIAKYAEMDGMGNISFAFSRSIKYNERNLPYDETCFSKLGIILWKRKYVYDVIGNRICEEMYVPDRSQPSNGSLLLDTVEETELLYY